MLLQGAIDVLKALGYSEETSDSLIFPQAANPDKDHVATVMADILIIKAELEHIFARNLGIRAKT